MFHIVLFLGFFLYPSRILLRDNFLWHLYMSYDSLCPRLSFSRTFVQQDVCLPLGQSADLFRNWDNKDDIFLQENVGQVYYQPLT